MSSPPPPPSDGAQDPPRSPDQPPPHLTNFEMTVFMPFPGEAGPGGPEMPAGESGEGAAPQGMMWSFQLQPDQPIPRPPHPARSARSGSAPPISPTPERDSRPNPQPTTAAPQRRSGGLPFSGPLNLPIPSGSTPIHANLPFPLADLFPRPPTTGNPTMAPGSTGSNAANPRHVNSGSSAANAIPVHEHPIPIIDPGPDFPMQMEMTFVIGPDGSVGQFQGAPGAGPRVGGTGPGAGANNMPFPFQFFGLPPFAQRPDPEEAKELLRSLPGVEKGLMKRVDRVYAAENVEEGGWKCGVCLEGWEEEAEEPMQVEGEAAEKKEKENGVKRLPCNHLFHAGCLQPWFETKHTCPSCRLDLDPLRTLRPSASTSNIRPRPLGPIARAERQQLQHPYQPSATNGRDRLAERVRLRRILSLEATELRNSITRNQRGIEEESRQLAELLREPDDTDSRREEHRAIIAERHRAIAEFERLLEQNAQNGVDNERRIREIEAAAGTAAPTPAAAGDASRPSASASEAAPTVASAGGDQERRAAPSAPQRRTGIMPRIFDVMGGFSSSSVPSSSASTSSTSNATSSTNQTTSNVPSPSSSSAALPRFEPVSPQPNTAQPNPPPRHAHAPHFHIFRPGAALAAGNTGAPAADQPAPPPWHDFIASAIEASIRQNPEALGLSPGEQPRIIGLPFAGLGGLAGQQPQPPEPPRKEVPQIPLEKWVQHHERDLGWRCDWSECNLAPSNAKDDTFGEMEIEDRPKVRDMVKVRGCVHAYHPKCVGGGVTSPAESGEEEMEDVGKDEVPVRCGACDKVGAMFRWDVEGWEEEDIVEVSCGA